MERILVGAGPEDMAIDHSTGVERIIVSCAERRNVKNKISGFFAINPRNYQTRPLHIIPEMTIHPHGIDIVSIDSIHYLYAISHEGEIENKEHKIYRFIIQNDSLILDNQHILAHQLMTGPNDLDVLTDGSFYVSNPMPSNDPMESTKAILGVKNGNVLHYDGKGAWSVVVENMCYPNGVWVDDDKENLFIVNGGCHEVVRYPIQKGIVNQDEGHSSSKHLLDITIGDNLLIDSEGTLWTAAHPCPLRFLSHLDSSENHSPSQVFSIDPLTLQPTLVFQNNGEFISAASTVLHLDNKLFISQVFDDFVLVVSQYD